jgi:uncharacterized protein YndB with AHSA1/START domain
MRFQRVQILPAKPENEDTTNWRAKRWRRKTPMKNTGTLNVTTPTDREIVLTRVFDAPRHMVFDAFTRPELLKRWFGPHGWSLVVCEVDLKVGGSYRFVLRGPDGRQMGMRGVYREITPPDRSVHTESFDDYPGESVVTTVLDEKSGKTTLTATILYASQEVRDAVVKSGMEHGAAESYDRLAELLASPEARPVETGGRQA